MRSEYSWRKFFAMGGKLFSIRQRLIGFFTLLTVGFSFSFSSVTAEAADAFGGISVTGSSINYQVASQKISFRVNLSDSDGIATSYVSCVNDRGNEVFYLRFQRIQKTAIYINESGVRTINLINFGELVGSQSGAYASRIFFDVSISAIWKRTETCLATTTIEDRFGAVRDVDSDVISLINPIIPEVPPTPNPEETFTPIPEETLSPNPEDTFISNPEETYIPIPEEILNSDPKTNISQNLLGFKFLPSKSPILKLNKRRTLITFGYQWNQDTPAFTLSFYEKRRKGTTYTLVKSNIKNNIASISRKDLRPGKYDFMVRAEFATGQELNLFIKGRIR
jgi:hypothetical protein